MTSLYSQRGVSAQKEEVHAATRNLEPGCFPWLSARFIPTTLGRMMLMNVMHADGAGTRAFFAYPYWKETGDISVWRALRRMRSWWTSMTCSAWGSMIILFSILPSTGISISLQALCWNRSLMVPGSSWKHANIRGKYSLPRRRNGWCRRCGKNSGRKWNDDVPLAKTGSSAMKKIKAGDVIVGLAGYGKATYESEYNSGLASNGLYISSPRCAW